MAEILTDRVFEIVSDSNLKQVEKLEELRKCLVEKGYGDREQELSFVSLFLKKVFSNHPELHTLEWSQYQDYNDNYLFFDLQVWKINKAYDINSYGFVWWEEDDWDYQFDFYDSKIYSEIDPKLSGRERVLAEEALYESLQEQMAPVKAALDKVLMFFLALYNFYRPFYFIYLFGRRAKVEVTPKGIFIDEDSVDYVNGSEKDETFRI